MAVSGGYIARTESQGPQIITERERLAGLAGRQMYSNIPSLQTSVDAGVPINGERSQLQPLPKERMSAVRRMFCLIVTFDLLSALILWVIYCQMQVDADKRATVWDNCWLQINSYTFDSSMFDTVLLAGLRFLVLILAYAVFRLLHWWPVAITTFVTCVFLLAKAFLFHFNTTKTHISTSFDYVLFIVSFVVAWGETWFMDFNVITKETKRLRTRAVMTVESPVTATERTPLIPDKSRITVTDDHYSFYTPRDSNSESGDSDHRLPFQNRTLDVTDNRILSPEQQYIESVKEAWDLLWDMFHDKSGWKVETGVDLESGVVHCRENEKSKKIFMLQGYVDIPAKLLYNDLVYNHDSMPTWNSTVLECSTIQILDDHTDVSYDVATEAAGGLVSSRDFVTLRRWGERSGYFISAGVAAVHPDKPPHKKHIRGENGPGGIIVQPVLDNPNRCIFNWIVDSDLKGWLPRKIIDQALSGTLMTYLKNLRLHSRDIHPANVHET